MSTTSQQMNPGGGREEDASSEDFLSTNSQIQINTQGTDDLLDEIDGLLEDNAEEFVRSYVQKGGE